MSVACSACNNNECVWWWKNWTSALVLKLSSIVRWTSFARLYGAVSRSCYIGRSERDTLKQVSWCFGQYLSAFVEVG